MVILIIKTKEFRGVGPGNGYPVKHLAYLFDDEDRARAWLKKVDAVGHVAEARIIGGYGEEHDIRDMRVQKTN